ncbi:MAG: hypothetical protein L0H36_02380 [bacterium]|nr:hypothetical protein [bacterium]
MFRVKKRYFFVPTDGSDPVVTYSYEDVKKMKRAQLLVVAKPWIFAAIAAIALIQVFVGVLGGDISLFRTEVIVVMAICGALGVYLAYRDERNYIRTAIVNAIAVACYALGTLLMIPLLFQQSDTFRHAVSSLTGHSTYDGSEGIIGASPWALQLVSFAVVAFLVYFLMVIAIIASLSSLIHAGDTKYIGKRPKKPKRKKLVVKRQDGETEELFAERQQAEANDFEKAVKKMKRSYASNALLWRYRKVVSTGFAPIWLSLIAVACSALYISESYFNATF